MQFSCRRPIETERLAAKLAFACPNGTVIYLQGDLGAGKSTFARAFIHALGFQGSVKSPTYSLLEVYALADGWEAVHMDLYRLVDSEEVAFLALDNYEKTAKVWLIEWPEKGLGYIRNADVIIRFTLQNSGRLLEIQAVNSIASTWLNAISP
jgi:tRNA threonylcarbamoyladenosine biosynthesis protein TsaE